MPRDRFNNNVGRDTPQGIQGQVEDTLDQAGVPISTHTLGVLPPQDQYAEESVLASLLIDGGRMAEVGRELKADHFYHARPRMMYSAMLALETRGQAVNAVSLQHELYERGQFQHEAFGEAGVKAYLLTLISTQQTSVYVIDYARIVRRCAEQRQMITALLAALDGVQAPDLQPFEYAEKVASEILAALPRPVELKTRLTLEEASFRMLSKAMDPVDESRLRSNFKVLDDALGGHGFQPGQLAILAGPPGNGKSTLAWQWAMAWAFWGKKVFVQSYEMGAEDLAGRAASRALRIEERGMYSAVRHVSEKTERTVSELNDWIGRTKNWPVVIETRGLTADDILAAVRHQKRLDGCDAVVIDHLQQVPSSDGAENRNLDLDKITNGLKQLAVSENLFVLCLSQVNRAAETQKGPLTHTAIRDSGAVPANADVVLTIRRSKAQPDDDRDKLELFVAKNRGGPDQISIELELEGRYASVHPWENDPTNHPRQAI